MYSNTDSVWFGFVDNGHYYFETYAIAPGKLASDTIAYDLGFSQPPTPWDFMEDDIFYKITGPGTVGVTECSDYTIFYDRYISKENLFMKPMEPQVRLPEIPSGN